MSVRMSRGSLIALGLAASSVMTSGSVHAQAWIGAFVGNMIAQQAAAQQEAACMSGAAMPDSEIAETRASAYAAMAGYWQAARAGGTIDATPYYQADGKPGWASGTTRLGAAQLTRVSDPLGSADAGITAEPIGYLRAGDGRTVWGQWRVQRADGTLVGTYDALFRRVDGKWKLGQLNVMSAREYVDPVVQFCHKPNDVLPYRLASTLAMRDWAAKRADKMRAKAEKAHAQLDKASARNDPAALAEARTAADDADKKAEVAANGLRLAVEANEKAKADAAEAEAAKAKAMAALAAN